jgi:hypothetical protein
MFGRRPDGTLVRDAGSVRAFMPFISPRRNDSLVLYSMDIEVDAAISFLEEANRRRPAERRMTLFQMYLYACAKGLRERPGVNRFTAGGRLWQRDHLAITFSAKQEIVDGSPMLTLKRIFPEGESLEEMVDSILDGLGRRRGGEETRSDKEVHFFLRLPPFLVRAAVWFFQQLNQLGLMPRSMIDDDPLFTSLFIANLGSVGLDSGYHHLWEWGTCSLFAVMGKVEERADGTRFMTVRYTYDERVEDGLYAAGAMAVIKQAMESPASLLP